VGPGARQDGHNNASVVIAPGGYAVLGRNGNSGTNGGYTANYVYSSFTLANTADEVVLLDGLGAIVDRVDYTGTSPWPNPTGASMALTSPAADHNVGTNCGVPAAPCAYIERGCLRQPIADLKYARRLGIRPTSVAYASDTLEFGGRRTFTLDEALTRCAGGALILSVLGVHTQDSASGDFSLSAPQRPTVRSHSRSTT